MSGEASSRNTRRLNEMRGGERDRWRAPILSRGGTVLFEFRQLLIDKFTSRH